MAELTIVNPVAEARAETALSVRFDPAPRLDSLAGKTVGLFWNGKNGGQYGLSRTKENLQRLYSDIRFVDYIGAHGAVMRRATPEQHDQMAEECDLVIGATAD
ncbi:MAG: hypothetical protein IT196_15340 [Acidimicrobiales bacterium]|nr:hypothetical protein [Acidimicrobiales bacterium]